MNLDFSFTPSLILLGLTGLLILIIGFIYVGRYYFGKQTANRLSNPEMDTDYKSPLEGRNKYPEVDVFKLSPVYFKMGLLSALLVTFLAMNLTTYEEVVEIPEDALVIEEDFEVEPPRTAEPPPPPPPPPPPVIQEVPDEVVLEDDDVEFVDQTITEETVVSREPAPVVEKKEEAAPPPPPPPPPPPKEEFVEIFKVVEEMPHFPGCESVSDKQERKQCADQKMLEFIYENIEYPSVARENGIQGTVVIQFVVSHTGAISDTQVVRDIGGGCGEEALRVVNLMNSKAGNWSPGRQRGKAVNVRFSLPVKFKLKT